MKNYDVAIVGGGIVGLATAYQLLNNNFKLQIIVLEKESEVAMHQTGHNSGVIHSGIYYKPGSLKAKNCIEGYELLIDFCNQNKIEYELCGKIIVATKEREIPILDNIYERGLQNGLHNLEILDEEGIGKIEPHCKGIKGIKVPQTGIVNYKKVCQVLQEKIEEKGGEVKTNFKVESIKTNNILEISDGKNIVNCSFMINCAGLYSDEITELSGLKTNTRIIPFRGEYYKLKPEAKHLVKHLIYPVPNPNFPFLGVHFTRMIDGKIEAGPNAVFAFRKEGYRLKDFNWKEFWRALTFMGFIKVMAKYWRIGLGEMKRSISKKAFTKALQELIPEIKEEHLEKAPAGVRAQACSLDIGLLDDFKIEQTPQMVHVINAPSPAATSSLAIGKKVADMYFKRNE